MALPLGLQLGQLANVAAVLLFTVVKDVHDGRRDHLVTTRCQGLISDKIKLGTLLQKVAELLMRHHLEPLVRDPCEVAETAVAELDQVCARQAVLVPRQLARFAVGLDGVLGKRPPGDDLVDEPPPVPAAVAVPRRAL